MDIVQFVALVLAGLAVGFINTLAGGGSVISLSLLMFFGLPAQLANGTNRIGILLQTLVSVRTFHNARLIEWKRAMWLAVPAVLGAVSGSLLAAVLKPRVFEWIIAVLLLIVAFLMIWQPEQWLKGNPEKLNRKPDFKLLVIFFLVGFYGGFIQAGVGFFLLSALVLGSGYDLVKANALKNLMVLLYTPFALLVYVSNGQVDWIYGLSLAVGNMTGAFLASRLAITKGAPFVRWIVILIIFLTILKLTGGLQLFFESF